MERIRVGFAGLGGIARDRHVPGFRALPGVSAVEVDGNRISLRATGDLDALVKLAGRHPLVDFVSAPPALEEIFLTYFGGVDGAAATDGDAGAT